MMWVLRTVLKKSYWKASLFLIVLITVWIIILRFRRYSMRRAQVQQRAQKQQACARLSADDTIFVSVASYRDPECHQTVFDCLEKAACPLRVFVGVCQQNYPVDIDALEGYQRLAKRKGSGNYRDQIRAFSMDAGQAQGPMYARSVIEQNLYRGERYYLIIDSHTLFTHDWDIRLIEMLQKCPSKKPVITMYPDNYRSRPKKESPSVSSALSPPSFLRFKKFNQRTGLPEAEGPLCKSVLTKPIASLFWGGGFSFASAQMMREVPYDPHCPYVFLGEEIAMAARLFTNGWDFFHPTDMVVRHMWQRRRPTFWEQFMGTDPVHRHRQTLEHKGYRRLRNLFQLQALQEGDLPLGQYGLGTSRTLADFQNYTGIDFLLQKTTRNARIGLTVNPSPEEEMAKTGHAANM